MNLPSYFQIGETKIKIARLLLEEKQTAADIAGTLKIQVSAARKHLESMQEVGLVTHEYAREGVGRPKKVFALTEYGHDLFPNQYSNMLNLLITKMLSANENWQVQEILEGIAEEVGMQIRNAANSASPKDISGAMNQFGFESYLDRRVDGLEGKRISIVTKNCPLYRIASKHQSLMCNAFHAAVLRAAFSAELVELESCMADGAGICKHLVLSDLASMNNKQTSKKQNSV